MKSDLQLKNEILSELAWDPAVRASDADVRVRNSVVTLRGHLESYAEKHVIERAVQRIHGVRAVVVEMDVRLGAGAQRTDAELAAAADHALAWHVQLPRGKVQPAVGRGWITLNGELQWNYQRKAAERAVRDLVGVRGVTNLISIQPRVAATDIRKNILDALARQADEQARQIEIVVADSQVTLRGKVHSWSERKAAQWAAWSAPGVSSVVNRLLIEQR
ncbi:MAG: BON domain-containing protein [Polaromonas sp.]|uniref:BON domain-containing protein n=1 Tax=Polaromonas sp. TaxID=1869339 RepID=UPI0040355085